MDDHTRDRLADIGDFNFPAGALQRLDQACIRYLTTSFYIEGCLWEDHSYLVSRSTSIDELVVLDWTRPSLVVEVTCSSGTYIRSLAHDLGQELGSGAYLAALVRLDSGRFTLEEAVSLERLEEAFQHGQEGEYLLPLDEALLDWPAMVVSSDKARRIVQGQAIAGDPPADEGSGGPSLCRAYSQDGDFLAIMTYHSAMEHWRPKKVFAPG